MKDTDIEIVRRLDKLVQIGEYRANIERLMLEKEGMRIPKLVIADNIRIKTSDETQTFTDKNAKVAKKVFGKAPETKTEPASVPVPDGDKKD